MSITRTMADVLKTIRVDREAWESLLAVISDDRKTEPGLTGGWTVKDLIAHITVYERWTVEWLEPALEGQATELELPRRRRNSQHGRAQPAVLRIEPQPPARRDSD